MSRQARPSSAARVLKERRDMVTRAAVEGLSNLVLFALEEGPEVSPKKLAERQGPMDDPLMMACLGGHLGVVQNLVEKCHASVTFTADVIIRGKEYEGVTPLWAAADSGNERLVRYLIQQGADVNKLTPLGVAAYSGHVTVVKCLLEHGADVNGVNSKGHSCLMNSCQQGPNFTQIVEQLLQKDVDVHYVHPLNGDTALHVAARCGAVDVGKLLIAHRATLSGNKYKRTPLMVAALESNDDFVDFLLDTPDFSRDEQADALELLGTSYWMNGNTARCLHLWERAMGLRYLPGKPVAEKRQAEQTVAVYGHAVEIQDLHSVQQLGSSGSWRPVGIQSLLVRERVLGKENPDTTYIIRFAAAYHSDDQDYTQAIDLLIHALDNIAGLFLFENHTLQVYELLLRVMGLSKSEENVSFSLLLGPLTRTLSDFQRGEKTRQRDKNEECVELRENMLKMILHMICVLQEVKERSDPEEDREFSQAVSSFVKTGVRGKGMNTLLHMACDADTGHFHSGTSQNQVHGYDFPCLLAVRVLLDAGCDVTAQNEAGQTALQVVRKERGPDNAEIIRLLMEDGSA